MIDRTKSLGAVYTPTHIVNLLVEWAVTQPDSTILDIGVGEGAFTFAAYDRLISLGAIREEALRQVYGSEIDPWTHSLFRGKAHDLMGSNFPNIAEQDFFDTEFPQVDAVIGNPPYVQRGYLHTIDVIRQKTIAHSDLSFSRQMDLYCYFVIRATSFLKPNGKLGVILSSSWLDSAYGKAFKQFLLNNYTDISLVDFDGRIFKKALVRATLLFAEKKSVNSNSDSSPVNFIRVKKDVTEFRLNEVSQTTNEYISSYTAPREDLEVSIPWGIFLKCPDTYFEINRPEKTIKLGEIADSRIGLQTLARNFYTLRKSQVSQFKIERKFLEPIMLSPRFISKPVLDSDYESEYFCFYCDQPREKLADIHVIRYIESAEKTKIKGKKGLADFIGYQNSPRIIKANRKPWYNIKTEIQRRGRYSILLPRRVYETYTTIWNKGLFIGNEDFIEVNPRDEKHTLILLAILNSSIGEFIIRMHSQLYGGGVCDLLPNRVRTLSIPNFLKWDNTKMSLVRSIYQRSIEAGRITREELDHAILDAMGIKDFRRTLLQSLNDVRDLSIQSKRK